MDKIYQIFVSSTFEDLRLERQEAMAAVVSTGNVPVGMEYFPAGDASPFDYIKQQIDSVDYYILIVAGKYGSINKETGISYTEMEFNYAVEKGVPIAVLQYRDTTKLTGDKLEIDDPKKRKLLEEFREKSKEGRVADFWESPAELRMKIKDAIGNLIKNSPRIGWVRADVVLNLHQNAETSIQDENKIREAERNISYAHNLKMMGSYVGAVNKLFVALGNLVQCKDKSRAENSTNEAMKMMYGILVDRDKDGKCRIYEGTKDAYVLILLHLNHNLSGDIINLIHKAQEVPQGFNELMADMQNTIKK